MKRVTGGQIRKTISITKGEILEVVEDDRFLMCPGHEYLMTCEYYWHHVSIILIASLFSVVLIGIMCLIKLDLIDIYAVLFAIIGYGRLES